MVYVLLLIILDIEWNWKMGLRGDDGLIPSILAIPIVLVDKLGIVGFVLLSFGYPWIFIIIFALIGILFSLIFKKFEGQISIFKSTIIWIFDPLKKLFKNVVVLVISFLLLTLLVVTMILAKQIGVKDAEKGRADKIRKADMMQAYSSQSFLMFYEKFYFTSDASDSIPVFTSRTNLITAINSSLKDPEGPNRHYVWLTNNWIFGETCKEGQFFCAYATLDLKGKCEKEAYFIVSEKGSSIICDTPPAYNIETGDCICF